MPKGEKKASTEVDEHITYSSFPIHHTVSDK